MPHVLRSMLLRYGTTVLAVLLVLLLKPLFEHGIFVLFLSVVMLSAWYGGKRAEERVRESADRSRVIAMIMRGTMIQAALGLTIGVPVTLLCVRFIETQLYEMKGMDAGVLAVSILTLVLAAAIAGLIPARRAASIDPVQALRTE